MSGDAKQPGGVAVYSLRSGGVVECTWTVPAFDGELGRETGVPRDALHGWAGERDVTIRDPGGALVYQGTLTIEGPLAGGSVYRMAWTGDPRGTWTGIGMLIDERRMAAAYWPEPDPS